jgi:hypothetical protein
MKPGCICGLPHTDEAERVFASVLNQMDYHEQVAALEARIDGLESLIRARLEAGHHHNPEE